MTDKTLEKIKEEGKRQVEKVMKSLKGKIPDKNLPMVEEAFNKILIDGVSPKHAMRIPPEVMELLYSHAYLLYQSGNYKKSVDLFQFLRMLDPQEKRYYFGLAANFHQMKDYLYAAANYILYQQLDPYDPVIAFHLYDCYRNTHHLEAALYFLEMAHALASENLKKYSSLKDKIQVELDSLKDALVKKFQEKQEAKK